MKEERRYHQAGTDIGAWQVPYCNMMTILMIFFLILYVYSQFAGINYEKALALVQSEVLSKSEKSLSALEETETALKLESLFEEKKIDEYAKVEMSAQRLKISLSNPVLFNLGEFELKKEAKKTLHEIGSIIQTLPNKVVVEGHTDNIPVTGGVYRSNWELSTARAFSVIRYFIEEGSPPERFTAYGYAEYRPVAPNDSEENRAKNRRIEISILRQQKK